ncbi:glutathione S-transferase family protein [Shewanella glacialimarina]|jgi:glutathione S-transferase|uniref:glutathione S-transferase family protein n=1 Tax=Shewanella glacialimarina TaxID=2590884 RepID=UPI001CF8BAD5|nr:glutathione S-transferase [Shewanella glacialimarina]UCX04201.1 glutathione S-transferase [Shewanella glacialimarina]
MITLHHLNQSRSKRILWLLEELGQAYQVKAYQRDKVTFLAPPELTAIHPLGKSPVIEHNGLVIAESGAITEYLINQYASHLAPESNSTDYVSYIQWLHFAESSAMLPLLLRLFVEKDGCQTNFIAGYADIEVAKVIGYLNASLEGKRYLVADKLTGADIMMSFVIEVVAARGELAKYPNLDRYYKQLNTHSGFTRASEIEAQQNTL